MTCQSDEWEQRYRKNPNYRNHWPYQEVVAFLARSISEFQIKPKLLEVGCGSGNNLLAADALGYDCHGIDASETIVRYALNFLEKKNIQANLKTAEFTSLPYENSLFDVVIDRSAVCLSSIDSIEIAIDEIVRVLKPGGLFFYNPPGEVNSFIPNFKGMREFKAEKGATNFSDINVVYTDREGIKSLLSKFECISVELITHSCNRSWDEGENVAAVYSEYSIVAKKL